MNWDPYTKTEHRLHNEVESKNTTSPASFFFFNLQYTKLYNIFIGYLQNVLNIYILHSLALQKLHINYSGQFLNSV